MTSSCVSQPRARGCVRATCTASQCSRVNGTSTRMGAASARASRNASSGRKYARADEGSPAPLSVSRTGAHHCQISSGTTAATTSRRRRGEFASGSAAHRSSGTAKATPRRLALPPIGDATAKASSAEPRYSATPQRSSRSRLGSSQSSSTQHSATAANASTENGWLPPSGKRTARTAAGVNAAAASQRPERGQAVRRAGRCSVRDAREREEQPGNGAGERREDAEREASAAVAVLERDHGAERERHPERERQATDEQVGDGAGGEPHRAAPRRLRAEVAAGDPFEQDGRGHGGERADDAHAQQRAERREQHGVRGHVVAAVPGEVEDRPAFALEELGAVDLRGEVGRRRAEREPRERERGRDVPGSDARCRHRADRRTAGRARCCRAVNTADLAGGARRQRRQAEPPSRACTRTRPGRSTRTRVMPSAAALDACSAGVTDHQRVWRTRTSALPRRPARSVKPSGSSSIDARGPADERRRAPDREDAPVRAAPDRAEVRRALGDELRLVARGVVERHVGHGDVGDGVLVEPGAVGRGGERAVVEERAVTAVELALPAARERDVRRDVRGFPVVLGERDLDAERCRAGCRGSGPAARGRPRRSRGRRCAHDVAHRGIELPVDERQRERDERGSAAADAGAARAGRRPGPARRRVRQPGDVAPKRRREGERGDAREPVDPRARSAARARAPAARRRRARSRPAPARRPRPRRARSRPRGTEGRGSPRVRAPRRRQRRAGCAVP